MGDLIREDRGSLMATCEKCEETFDQGYDGRAYCYECKPQPLDECPICGNPWVAGGECPHDENDVMEHLADALAASAAEVEKLQAKPAMDKAELFDSVMESLGKSVLVEVCYSHSPNDFDPFVCLFIGKCAGVIEEIEKQLLDDDPDDSAGAFTIRYHCVYDPGQYGDEGRCEIAPYWDMTELSRVTIEEMESWK
jgi:hypothetical protein